MSLLPSISIFLSFAILTACASNDKRADTFAADHGFGKSIARGTDFHHVVYHNSAAVSQGTLHVYIEGDGIPFEKHGRVSTDPTPRTLLMLNLMTLDTTPSIYIGRPCYFKLDRDGICNARWWTTYRYSPEVIASMAAVVKEQAAKTHAQTIEIYGHSGGGTLALLIAELDSSVSRVVTIGANLDLAAWSQLHHYSPLVGSISPITATPRRTNLRVLHLVGSLDTNTPSWLIQNAAKIRGGEPVKVIDGFDHVCCWEHQWPRILSSD